MKLPIALLLAFGAHSASLAQACPANATLVMPNLSASERGFAQAFANCLTDRTIVSTSGRMANLAACRANMPVRRSAALDEALQRVERTALNLGDCQTRITITAKAKGTS